MALGVKDLNSGLHPSAAGMDFKVILIWYTARRNNFDLFKNVCLVVVIEHPKQLLVCSRFCNNSNLPSSMTHLIGHSDISNFSVVLFLSMEVSQVLTAKDSFVSIPPQPVCF